MAEGTFVVTGAAGNLGRAVAARLAGANLVLVGHDAEKLDAAFPGLSGDQMKLAVDLTDQAATAQALHAAEAHFGGIDGLAAIAGGFHMGEMVHEAGDDVWAKMHAMNVATMLNAVRAVVPGMIARGSGRIVTVGANGALKGAAKMAAYIAAKSTVMRLSEAMAAELGAKGIGVNCILPGTIDTPQNREAMPKVDPGKWTPPEEIAESITFLLSPQSAAINGALVPVTA